VAGVSVAANGAQVVQGTITVKEYGKQDPNEQVQLTGATEATNLVAGAKATVCNGSTTVWPGGNIATPLTAPVIGTTDSTGSYQFTATVGTQPWTWALNAIALNALGVPSTNPANASVKVLIDISSAGSARIDDFVHVFDAIAPKTASVQNPSSPSGLASSLADLPPGGPLDGLAYAVADNDKAGSEAVMIIYKQGTPPSISSKGVVTPAAGDLILDPGEWVGVPGQISVNWETVASQGAFPDMPTYEQWASGADLKGWHLIKDDTLSLNSGNFQWFGWAYPGIQSPGACY
jgi:hypothetical protein